MEDILDDMKLLRIAIIDCVKPDPGPQWKRGEERPHGC